MKTAKPIERTLLERNLEILEFYCNDRVNSDHRLSHSSMRFMGSLFTHGFLGSFDLGFWPTHGLLRQIQADVTVLAERSGVGHGFPPWKTFKRVNRLYPKLRLKERVDRLIIRARAMVPDESELSEAVWSAQADGAMAQCEWRDRVMEPEKFAELLQAHQQALRACWMAETLVGWLVEIGHPRAKDFGCTEDIRKSWKRRKGRARTRSCRQRKKTLQK